MTDPTYPENVRQFMDWYKDHLLANTTEVPARNSVVQKAASIGLKLLFETSKDTRSIIVFDPEVPDQAFEVRSKEDITSEGPKPLSKAEQSTFDATLKTLAGLISDHDVSTADMNKIAAMRADLKAAGFAITVTNSDTDCYIGLTMNGTAKYKHATLNK